MAAFLDPFLDMPAGDFFKPVLDDARAALRQAAPALRGAGRLVGGGLRIAGRIAWPIALAYGVYEAWKWRDLIQGMLPTGSWRRCCTSFFWPRLSHVRSGWDYTSGANCTAPLTTCLAAQADGSPFNAYTGAETRRRFYHQYEIAPGSYRYDIVITDTTGTINAPVVPGRARPSPLWFVPAALVPKESARATDVVGAPPRPLPWGAIPRARPLPGSAQTREAGYEAGPKPLLPPIVVTIGDKSTDSGSRARVRPIEHPEVINRPHPAEQKVRLDARSRAMFRAMAAYSEANDFIDVFWAALPASVRRRYANTSYGRLLGVIQNMDQINWAMLPLLIANNELGDISNATRLGVARDISDKIDPTGTLWRAWQSFGY